MKRRVDLRIARSVLLAGCGAVLLSLSWPRLAGAQAASPQVMPAAMMNSATAAPANTLYLFDLEAYFSRQPTNKTWQYDVLNFVTALQGLVNRDRPRLYIFYVRETLSAHELSVDHFWLEHLEYQQ